VTSQSACRTAGYLGERTSRPRRVMPRRRHTSPAVAPCTPHRLKPSRRGPSRLILHPQRTRDPWSGSPGGGPCEAFMPAERILRALPSCWSGALWGGRAEVAWLRTASLSDHGRIADLAWLVRPIPDQQLAVAAPMTAPSRPGRTAGSRPDRILLAASQPTTDQADPPAVSPADPVADSPAR
jgi:hypothetical protein